MQHPAFGDSFTKKTVDEIKIRKTLNLCWYLLASKYIGIN
jgi:hypothetical protein